MMLKPPYIFIATKNFAYFLEITVFGVTDVTILFDAGNFLELKAYLGYLTV